MKCLKVAKSKEDDGWPGDGSVYGGINVCMDDGGFVMVCVMLCVMLYEMFFAMLLVVLKVVVRWNNWFLAAYGFWFLTNGQTLVVVESLSQLKSSLSC